MLYLRVRREHDLKASIKQESIYVVGPHAAADAVGCLEHLTSDTSTGQILRTTKTGETRANDHDISHNNPHRSDPAHISFRSATERVGDARADAIVDDVHQQRVRTEGGGDEIPDIEMVISGFGDERRDIAIPMIARPKEVRRDYHRCGTGGYARVERCADR